MTIIRMLAIIQLAIISALALFNSINIAIMSVDTKGNFIEPNGSAIPLALFLVSFVTFMFTIALVTEETAA